MLGTDHYSPDPDYDDIAKKEISFDNIDELFEFDMGEVVDKIKEGTVTVGTFFKEGFYNMFGFFSSGSTSDSPNEKPNTVAEVHPAQVPVDQPSNDDTDEGDLDINRRSLYADKEIRGSSRIAERFRVEHKETRLEEAPA